MKRKEPATLWGQYRKIRQRSAVEIRKVPKVTHLTELYLGDLVAKIPIIQGGMGVGISLSRLSSAVGNEGGIGVIVAAMIGIGDPDVLTNPKEANF